MELRQLAHFVTVAEERHFTRAAERVHVAQSSLSASIRTLEREVGTALLVRTSRHVELTEAGRELLPHARRALAAAGDARAAVDAVRGVLRGHLTVGLIQSPVLVDVPGLLARYRRRYPGITVTVRHASVPVLVAATATGEVDLAFVDRPFDDGGVTERRLGRQELVVAVAPDDPLADRPEVALTALADRDFVDYRADSALRALIDEHCARAGLRRRTCCETDTMATLLDLVAAGVGIALVPPPPGDRVATVRPVPTPAREIGLVTAAGRALPPAAAAFLALLDESGAGVR